MIKDWVFICLRRITSETERAWIIPGWSLSSVWNERPFIWRLECYFARGAGRCTWHQPNTNTAGTTQTAQNACRMKTKCPEIQAYLFLRCFNHCQQSKKTFRMYFHPKVTFSIGVLNFICISWLMCFRSLLAYLFTLTLLQPNRPLIFICLCRCKMTSGQTAFRVPLNRDARLWLNWESRFFLLK